MTTKKSRSDSDWLALAAQEAQAHYPAPNPRVGCVIVRDDDLVGRGGHVGPGQPHAEVMALRDAGDAKGATAYVTLEPCNHYGRTPPCSRALVEAGVARVVYGAADPNPLAQGGAEALRAAGIETDLIPLTPNPADTWLTAQRQRRPYVMAKFAVTGDGFMAPLDRSQKWITGPSVRAIGYEYRALMGAILVGAQTVLADDPALDAREFGAANPITKVILDPQRRTLGERNLDRSPGPVLRLHDLDGTALAALGAIWRAGITSILVEGGPNTVQRFLDEGLVNEIRAFRAEDVKWGEGIPAPVIPDDAKMTNERFHAEDRVLEQWHELRGNLSGARCD